MLRIWLTAGSALFTIVNWENISFLVPFSPCFFDEHFGAVFGAKMVVGRIDLYKFYLSFLFALACQLAPKILNVKLESVTELYI
jgi:hypothetical protein